MIAAAAAALHPPPLGTLPQYTGAARKGDAVGSKASPITGTSSGTDTKPGSSSTGGGSGTGAGTSTGIGGMPLIPVTLETPDAALLHSVRVKMSTRDQEAMRRARWTMIEGSDTASSSLSAGNLPPDFSTLPRRSNLAKQFTMPSVAESSAAAAAAAIGGRSVSGPQPSSSAQAVPSAPAMAGTPTPPSYVIAVIGHDGVGKSTVIRRAVKTWGGGSKPTKVRISAGHNVSSCFAQVKAGGRIPQDCQVEFVEVPLKALDLSGVGPVFPPVVSPPSGVIVCYDAKRVDTLRGLSEALHILAPTLPMVMFACKSDPDAPREVKAHVGDQIGQPYNVGLIEVTTASAQGKHKMRTGFRWLLYRLEERQHADTDADLDEDADTGDSKASSKPGKWGHTPGRGEVSDTHSSSSSLGWIMDGGSGATSTEGSIEGPAPGPTLERELMEPPATAAAETDETWIALPDLINRLFTTIVSTESDRFVQTFFIIYRRFSLPRDLMKEFHERFVECEHYDVSRDIRLWALMKMAGALLYWANKYPGDFVDSVTQDLYRKTLGHMVKYTFIAHITADLARIESQFGTYVDIDESWSWRPPVVTPSTVDDASLQTEDTAVDDGEGGDEKEEGDTTADTVTAETIDLTEPTTPTSQENYLPSITESLSSLSAEMDSHHAQLQLRSVKTADSGSEVSRSLHSSTSTRSTGHRKWSTALQAITNMDPHVFALELTRMQWELFAAIRCRDILRHDFGRERDDPVGRSIEFFNHLSRLVSTMILAHPKPKGRARVYEHFVKIAHRLRRLNNYDGLCAVIAGLRETSIHRLAQTHAAVRLDATLARDYQSHIRLMDPRSGYMHYRRALQADSTYSHHAIPLLTTVLSLVNRLHAARPEDRRADGTVAWDKFARFGAMMSVIPEFQARGCNVPGEVNASFRRLIEATPVIRSEDGLYERSKGVEPGVVQGGGLMRKLASLGIQQR